ncbi:hypothetical protein Hte_009310 [Hypoxylon texense]
MIMPSEVQITRASDLEAQRDGKDAAMIRQGAVIGKSDRMCATDGVLPRPVHSGLTTMSLHDSQASLFLSSASSRRARKETIIYAASGKGMYVMARQPRTRGVGVLTGSRLVTSAGADEEPKRHELSAGDFAFIPPWTEHQEINQTDENVVWILIRSGPEPVVVYLTGWGGDEAKADAIP